MTFPCWHTISLDAHRKWGNNWGAAHDLGWSDLEPFGKSRGEEIGVRGTFPEIPVEAFCRKLEEYYDHKAHFALGGRETIQSAALISGGAHREISLAAQEGVGAFITGSFDEPVWHIAHEEQIHFFALGHSNTEKIGVQKLGAFLAQHFGLETTFLDVPNPF